MQQIGRPERCLTCGAPLAPRARSRMDEEDEEQAFCSIHCEHYFGLMRASETAHPHAPS